MDTVSLPNTSSERAPESTKSDCDSSCSDSYEVENLPSNSSVGLAEVIRTTPPIAFLPKRVGCGPRKTSTLSKSTRGVLANWLRG